MEQSILSLIDRPVNMYPKFVILADVLTSKAEIDSLGLTQEVKDLVWSFYEIESIASDPNLDSSTSSESDHETDVQNEEAKQREILEKFDAIEDYEYLKGFWDLSDSDKLEFEVLEVVKPQIAKSLFRNEYPDRDFNSCSVDLRVNENFFQ